MKLLSSVLLLMLASLVGCHPQATVGGWQSDVERFVQEQGNNDPAVLRSMTLPDGRPGFAVIGAPKPSEATDVNALLVGHREIAGEPTFIYLLGVVQRQRVDDIRLALVSFQGEQAQAKWTIGKSDPQATEAYQSYLQRKWKERLSGRDEVPAAYLGFPGVGDVFDLNISGTAVSAQHAPSGAVWEVDRGAARR